MSKLLHLELGKLVDHCPGSASLVKLDAPDKQAQYLEGEDVILQPKIRERLDEMLKTFGRSNDKTFGKKFEGEHLSGVELEMDGLAVRIPRWVKVENSISVSFFDRPWLDTDGVAWLIQQQHPETDKISIHRIEGAEYETTIITRLAERPTKPTDVKEFCTGLHCDRCPAKANCEAFETRKNGGRVLLTPDTLETLYEMLVTKFGSTHQQEIDELWSGQVTLCGVNQAVQRFHEAA